MGTRAGTKAKREQATMLRDSYLVGLLRFLVRTASVDGPLVGVSYTTYRKLLKKVESLIGISAGYTPHSPRAGFASESYRDGMEFTAIKEQGRWLVDSSLRCYIDVVGLRDPDEG